MIFQWAFGMSFFLHHQEIFALTETYGSQMVHCLGIKTVQTRSDKFRLSIKVVCCLDETKDLVYWKQKKLKIQKNAED